VSQARYRILVTDTLADSGLELFRSQTDVDLDYRPGLAGAELHREVATADAIVTRSGTAVTDELLSHAKQLRVVGRAGVGLDNVDVDASTRRGILVINAPTANILSATEHTMAMMLALCRNVPGADASVRRGEWKRSKFMGVELSGKTLGIIGLGRIGGTLCGKALGLFRRVLACDPYIPEERFRSLGAVRTSLEPLLGESDVVSIHCNLTDETRFLICERTLALMRPRAILINTARGPVVDEEALVRALESGRLHGAGLDCFWDEPPLANRDRLLAHPRVIATGHYAWYSSASGRELQRRAAENMVAMLEGRIPQDCLNP